MIAHGFPAEPVTAGLTPGGTATMGTMSSLMTMLWSQ
jgi:hypothetical protein